MTLQMLFLHLHPLVHEVHGYQCLQVLLLVLIDAVGTGFDADDGAALYMTFRALQSESIKQGEAHKAIAHELATLVADPFGEWATGHAVRISIMTDYPCT